jgi:uncharacterized Zn finger protein
MGCERCADPTTYHPLEQLAVDSERHSFLLRCPRCGSLHELFPEEKQPARELTPAEARAHYPGAV